MAEICLLSSHGEFASRRFGHQGNGAKASKSRPGKGRPVLGRQGWTGPWVPGEQLKGTQALCGEMGTEGFM